MSQRLNRWTPRALLSRRCFGLSALAALAAAVVLMAVPVTAVAGADQPPPGNIKGFVATPPATPGTPPVPVENATVRLVRPNGTVIAVTHTNAEGKYGFPNVHPGPYRLQAFKEGVGHGVRHTFVHPGQTVIVPIGLHP